MRDQRQDHHENGRHLDDYPSHELAAEDLKFMTAHLQNCAVCAARFVSQQKIKAALQVAVANDDPVSALLRSRIRAQTIPAKKLWLPSFFYFRELKKLAWLLATAFQLMTFGSGSLMQKLQRQRTSKRETIAVTRVMAEQEQTRPAENLVEKVKDRNSRQES